MMDKRVNDSTKFCTSKKQAIKQNKPGVIRTLFCPTSFQKFLQKLSNSGIDHDFDDFYKVA